MLAADRLRRQLKLVLALMPKSIRTTVKTILVLLAVSGAAYGGYLFGSQSKAPTTFKIMALHHWSVATLREEGTHEAYRLAVENYIRYLNEVKDSDLPSYMDHHAPLELSMAHARMAAISNLEGDREAVLKHIKMAETACMGSGFGNCEIKNLNNILERFRPKLDEERADAR
ncbi:MAG: hypothetical protein AB8B96_04735 [Lysobacterales bacterium]